MNNNTFIQDRTRAFGVRVIKAYCELNKRKYDDAGKVSSKQFLRSGTSIGANLAESRFARSKPDYISKISIALAEAAETEYWIKMMIESEIVTENKFELLLKELNEIISILVTSLNSLKNKN
jgi:four helix bundle protein